MPSRLLILKWTRNQRNRTCCWLSTWRWASTLLPMFWDNSVRWDSTRGWRMTVKWYAGQFSCRFTNIPDLKLQPKTGFTLPKDFKDHHHSGLTLSQIILEPWIDWPRRVKKAPSTHSRRMSSHTFCPFPSSNTKGHLVTQLGFISFRTTGSPRNMEGESEAEHTERRSVKEVWSQVT